MFQRFQAFLKRNRAAVNLDDLAGMWSPKTDAIILQKEKECQYQYIGGHFIIVCLNEKYFNVTIDLYFKNQDDEFVEAKSTSKPKSLSILTAESVAELQRQQKIVFDIQAPNKE